MNQCMQCKPMLLRYFVLLSFIFIIPSQADDFLDTFIRKFNSSIDKLTDRKNELQNSLKELPPLTYGQQGEQVGIHSHYMDTPNKPLEITVELKREYPLDFLALVPVSRVFQGANYSSYGFPRGFKVQISSNKDFSDSKEVFSTGTNDYEAPGHYPLIVPVKGQSAKFIKISISKHWARPDGQFLSAIGELMAISGNRNIAIGAQVSGYTFVSLPEWDNDFLVDGQTDLGMPISNEPSKVNGLLTTATKNRNANKWIELDLGAEYEIDEIRLMTAHPLDAPSSYSHGFPVKFKLLASKNKTFNQSQTVADYSETEYRRLGNNMAVFPAENIKCRFIKLDVNELWHISGKHRSIALSEIQVLSKGKNVALNCEVMVSDLFDNDKFRHIWNKAGLVDGFTSQNKLIDIDQWLLGLDQRRITEDKISELEAQLQKAKESTTRKVIAVFALVVILLTCTVVLNIYRRRQKMKKELEKVRVQIARDLHDDLGSRIGGIRLVSEVALADNSLSVESREDWKSVNESAAGAIEAMRDIVWLTDGEAVSSEQMIKHLHKVAEETLSSIKLIWQAEGDLNINIPFTQRRQIVLSFRETLGNVVKHSGASEVTVKILSENNHFSFTVDDNGCGFDLKNCSLGRGLNNLQQRADQSGGKFEVNSNSGEGTSVNFTITLRGLYE